MACAKQALPYRVWGKRPCTREVRWTSWILSSPCKRGPWPRCPNRKHVHQPGHWPPAWAWADRLGPCENVVACCRLRAPFSIIWERCPFSLYNREIFAPESSCTLPRGAAWQGCMRSVVRLDQQMAPKVSSEKTYPRHQQPYWSIPPRRAGHDARWSHRPRLCHSPFQSWPHPPFNEKIFIMWRFQDYLYLQFVWGRKRLCFYRNHFAKPCLLGPHSQRLFEQLVNHRICFQRETRLAHRILRQAEVMGNCRPPSWWWKRNYSKVLEPEGAQIQFYAHTKKNLGGKDECESTNVEQTSEEATKVKTFLEPIRPPICICFVWFIFIVVFFVLWAGRECSMNDQKWSLRKLPLWHGCQKWSTSCRVSFA